jgi:hypothetical protein
MQVLSIGYMFIVYLDCVIIYYFRVYFIELFNPKTKQTKLKSEVKPLKL